MSKPPSTPPEKHGDRTAPVPGEAEYETSPDAPYNRAAERHRGSSANEPPRDRDDEIERTKQYYYGGKKPQS